MAYPAVNDIRCGHIEDTIQQDILESCPIMLSALGVINNTFINNGQQVGECRNLLSHLLCPLIWHIIHGAKPETRQHISVSWLNYGAPDGLCLDVWLTDHCTINNSAAIYSHPIWAKVVKLINTQAPDIAEWLLMAVTQDSVDIDGAPSCLNDRLLTDLGSLALAAGGRRTRRKQRKNRRSRCKNRR